MKYAQIDTMRDYVGWRAVPDNYDGSDCPIGWGATEAEAIEDLLWKLEDESDAH